MIAYILGILSFLFAITGIFSFLLSIPGLVLAIGSLKSPEKTIMIPLGYQGRVGKKKLTARPFITTRYLSYIAIGLNIFSMAVALFTTLSVLALFTVGMR
ncbi:hypothetical protein A3A55_03595 [Candidatus Roizmanbacteria bacterium RIFCSPLOWO2_01_FULL_40_14]|nr:MAG: hypothetical protein A3A55_03595 [Candidatus Roizmanbacteria bacterium RIFCSPLOWO2_01_FULL_40_14]